MQYIIAAIVILLVGAAAEITAYVFTDRLLKKREEGLDRRKDEITLKEGELVIRESQIALREANVTEREKQIPKGIMPTEHLEVVTTTRPIRKLCADAIMDVDALMGSYGVLGTSSCQPFISEYTERVKDGLRDEICKIARDAISFSMSDDVYRGKRKIAAELWVAGGGPEDVVS